MVGYWADSSHVAPPEAYWSTSATVLATLVVALVLELRYIVRRQSQAPGWWQSLYYLGMALVLIATAYVLPQLLVQLQDETRDAEWLVLATNAVITVTVLVLLMGAAGEMFRSGFIRPATVLFVRLRLPQYGTRRLERRASRALKEIHRNIDTRDRLIARMDESRKSDDAARSDVVRKREAVAGLLRDGERTAAEEADLRRYMDATEEWLEGWQNHRDAEDALRAKEPPLPDPTEAEDLLHDIRSFRGKAKSVRCRIADTTSQRLWQANLREFEPTDLRAQPPEVPGQPERLTPGDD